MNTQKKHVHFVPSQLLQPTNPIEVFLIGAGGTGSQVLTSLARMNFALNELGHAGLQVTLWDDDIVSEANLGRQLFAESELGLHKAVALINRCNRFFGTCWSARTMRFTAGSSEFQACIYVSCVDSVAARFDIARALHGRTGTNPRRSVPMYWMDYGNSAKTGQVILSTIRPLKQPASARFTPVDTLPFVTEEFKSLLTASQDTDDTPSCSLAEALTKQDLFINSTLAQMGSSLLWTMFRQGYTEHRGVFLNLDTFRSQPLPVG